MLKGIPWRQLFSINHKVHLLIESEVEVEMEKKKEGDKMSMHRNKSIG